MFNFPEWATIPSRNHQKDREDDLRSRFGPIKALQPSNSNGDGAQIEASTTHIEPLSAKPIDHSSEIPETPPEGNDLGEVGNSMINTSSSLILNSLSVESSLDPKETGQSQFFGFVVDDNNDSVPIALASSDHDSHPTSIDRDEPLTIPISHVTVMKIVDRRPGPVGVEYRCRLESQWMAQEVVQKMKMGSVCMRGYEGNLIRAARLNTLRPRKRRLLEE